MTDTNPKQIAISGLKIAVEASLAFLLVVGVCWGLCNWAQHQAARPITAGPDGIILLQAPQATLSGSVEFLPNDKEKQTADFAYHFGRELLAERNERTIQNWSGEDAQVQWSFVVAPAKDKNTTYKVSTCISAPPESAGNRFTVSVIDISNPAEPKQIKQFDSTVTSSGAWDLWQIIKLGQAELPPSTYRLVVTPEGAIKGSGLMGIMGIELEPVK